MNLQTALIVGFLFHLVGDYLLQNDWMAQEKTKNSFACFIHCFLYTLPFVLILFGSNAIWIVFITHFFMDRFRLATYWIKLMNWNWQSTNFGYSSEKPTWMSVWLMIIVDNTFHLCFNSLAIYIKFA